MKMNDLCILGRWFRILVRILNGTITESVSSYWLNLQNFAILITPFSIWKFRHSGSKSVTKETTELSFSLNSYELLQGINNIF